MARRLCFEERVRIEAMAQAGVGAAEAARRLGRHPVTVQRELGRNKGPGGYGAEAAQAGSCARAARPKAPELARDAELAAAVCERLAQRWPPPPISADLGALGLRVCAETIYRACYDRTGRRGLAERSWTHLPRQHRRRKPRGRTEQAKRSALGEFRPLAERPAEADTRAEPGHWEGDLIIAKANRTAVATLVERTSRHTLVVPLPDGYSAPATARAVTAALARQPSHMVKTLTWDQGREMARWAHIEKNLAIEVYFCEPRSPWQQPDQRANQRTPATLAPQKHRPQHRPGTPRHHRRPPQHHAPTHPQLELSPNRLHCPQLQPPIELAARTPATT